MSGTHDDVIKWKHFSRYWPFLRGIHRSPVNSPHKGQWHGPLRFSLVCAWTNSNFLNYTYTTQRANTYTYICVCTYLVLASQTKTFWRNSVMIYLKIRNYIITVKYFCCHFQRIFHTASYLGQDLSVLCINGRREGVYLLGWGQGRFLGYSIGGIMASRESSLSGYLRFSLEVLWFHIAWLFSIPVR